MSTLFVGAIIFWLVPIFVTISQGRAKGRAGFLYGLFLGWVGVIILAVLSPVAGHPGKDLSLYRECPHCKEPMRRDATVCPHCHSSSAAWELRDGRWWDGPLWLDERTREWHQQEAL